MSKKSAGKDTFLAGTAPRPTQVKKHRIRLLSELGVFHFYAACSMMVSLLLLRLKLTAIKINVTIMKPAM